MGIGLDQRHDNYVDNADFVFYTGHANINGWVLAVTGGDGWLDFTETGASPGNPGDLWGQSKLEWVMIAACGPLQDDVIFGGGGDVFARWDGAFDGIHTLLGYGAITYDNTDEGRKVAQYCKGGSTVINSWFRAAQEIQPSTNGASAPDGPTVWVGAMWVGKDGADPFNDHAWDYGSVSAIHDRRPGTARCGRRAEFRGRRPLRTRKAGERRPLARNGETKRYFFTWTSMSCASPSPLRLSSVTTMRPSGGVSAYSAEFTEMTLLESVYPARRSRSHPC